MLKQAAWQVASLRETEESQGLMKLTLRPTVNLNLYPETQHIQMELG